MFDREKGKGEEKRRRGEGGLRREEGEREGIFLNVP